MDEIVVVDTGSTDDTVDVARRHAANVLHHTWNGDFSAAGKVGVMAARGKWILFLDCDEVLAGVDHAAICEIVRGAQYDAYRLTTRNYTDESNRNG